jgi:ketosteroid isomerase-like protein
VNKKDPKLTVLLFNKCINNQDINGLTKFMAEDVKLIMGNEVTQNNKEEAKSAWMQFFEMCPDYKNHFNRIESKEDIVCVFGYSTCSNKSVEGPALWRVQVENDLISEWQILEDTEDNRKFLKLSLLNL